jgi:WD40 repeat protein
MKINKIELIDDKLFPKRRSLLVHTDFVLKSFRIKKETKSHNMVGHTGPILKIIALEPSKMEKIMNEKIPDTTKVITASLDNTILLWDYEKMEILSKMEAPKNSELTCITFLYNCCLVASGHEDGAIRLWNMEINSSVLLRCTDPNKKHTNTISCITSTIWKKSEFLICGSYDGKVSIWEISEKSSQSEDNSGTSTITPQLRHVIDNKKEV